MKKTLLLAVYGFVLALPPVQAASINRGDFNVGAGTYDLAGVTNLTAAPTNGEVTLTNGYTINVGSLGLLHNEAYYDGGDLSVIRIDFANAVSAFGLDWLASQANPTLSVFDSGNSLLESLTLDWTTFPLAAGFPFGFIGINVGNNTIAYATIDTPLSGHELYIDNLIYQRVAAVSAPATLPLLAIGGFALAARRRKAA